MDVATKIHQEVPRPEEPEPIQAFVLQVRHGVEKEHPHRNLDKACWVEDALLVPIWASPIERLLEGSQEKLDVGG